VGCLLLNSAGLLQTLSLAWSSLMILVLLLCLIASDDLPNYSLRYRRILHPGLATRSFPSCLLSMYRCTRTHAPHPPTTHTQPP